MKSPMAGAGSPAEGQIATQRVSSKQSVAAQLQSMSAVELVRPALTAMQVHVQMSFGG